MVDTWFTWASTESDAQRICSTYPMTYYTERITYDGHGKKRIVRASIFDIWRKEQGELFA